VAGVSNKQREKKNKFDSPVNKARLERERERECDFESLTVKLRLQVFSLSVL
jgi:hypothetical protein